MNKETNDIRKIRINQGKEFQIYVHKDKINKDDIFIQSYRQAVKVVNDLVSATKEYHDKDEFQRENRADFLNNIIAFCGERGQGKSSAMVTFMNELCKVNPAESNLEFSKDAKNSTFFGMDIIDPATFEDFQNVLEIIVSRMYKTFEKMYRSGEARLDKYQVKDITIAFQEAYKSIGILKNSKKLQEGEYEFEGDIEKLSQLGDSSMFRNKMIGLVKQYLKLVSGCNCVDDKYLVIPIDDLDVSIHSAYSIAERIRKYLMIPNVIILMAIKVEQLRYCAEMKFTNQLADLQNTKTDFVRKEAKSMAGKYIDKLIPNGRKIYLPEIRVMNQSGESKVQIIYESKEEGKGNLLSLESLGVKKKNENQAKDSLLGIDEEILSFIYQKTGIIFVKKQEEIHQIVPNNLRELVSLLAVLGEMNTPAEDDKKLYIENIKKFREYFINTWIVNNVVEEYQDIIEEFLENDLWKKHKFICCKLFERIKNDRKCRYEESEKDLKELDYQAIGYLTTSFGIKQRNKKGSYFMLGDALHILDTLESDIPTRRIQSFVFAIKTLYTIDMNLMYQRQENNLLYEYIGGRLWSVVKQRKLIRSGNSRAMFTFNTRHALERFFSRMRGEGKKYFAIIVKQILGILLQDEKEELVYETEYIDVLNEEDALRSYLIFGFMCRFIKSDSDIDFQRKLIGFPIIAGNSARLKEARFTLDDLFLSCIDKEVQYENMALKKYANKEIKSKVTSEIDNFLGNIGLIPINIELIDACYSKCVQKKDIKDKATERDYYDNFIKSINGVLNELNAYLGYNVKLRGISKGTNMISEIYSSFFSNIGVSEHENMNLNISAEEQNKSEEISGEKSNDKLIERIDLRGANNYSARREKLAALKKQLQKIEKNDSLKNTLKNKCDLIEISLIDKEGPISKDDKDFISKKVRELNELIESYNDAASKKRYHPVQIEED